MTDEEMTKYQNLIERGNVEIDALTFHDRELIYRGIDNEELRMKKVQKGLKKLANKLEESMIELRVLDFLENGHNNPEAQDVEYN
jgi:hypothetical protein